MLLITQVVSVICATSHIDRFDSGRDIIHAALLLSVSVEWIIPELFRFKGFNKQICHLKGSKWKKSEVMVHPSPLSALIVRKCNQCTRDRGDSFWTYIHSLWYITAT